MRQFGFGQGAVWIQGDVCFSSIRGSESRFICNGRNKIFLILVISFSLVELENGRGRQKGEYIGWSAS